MNYEIYVTLGPATAAPQLWQRLLDAGATAFRLNTSHLSLNQLAGWLEQIGSYFNGIGKTIPVALDLQGSKWRLGDFAPYNLVPGQQILFRHGETAAGQHILPVPHADFFQAVPQSNGEITLNDAKIHLTVLSAARDEVVAQVKTGGLISPHKGISLPGTTFRIEQLSEKDRQIIRQTRELSFIRYAISYVRDKAEMARYRSWMDGSYLIAKLERQPAVDEPAAIAAYADECWLCRGDLGAELGLPGMAAAAHRLNRQAAALGVPFYLAGQVLEHMAEHENPTRSEITAIYDALACGCRGLVLSDETAVGKFPVEACQAAAMFRSMG